MIVKTHRIPVSLLVGKNKSPGPSMLELLGVEGDHVWYYRKTVNRESGDPVQLLFSCVTLGKLLFLSGSQFAHMEKRGRNR